MSMKPKMEGDTLDYNGRHYTVHFLDQDEIDWSHSTWSRRWGYFDGDRLHWFDTKTGEWTPITLGETVHDPNGVIYHALPNKNARGSLRWTSESQIKEAKENQDEMPEFKKDDITKLAKCLIDGAENLEDSGEWNKSDKEFVQSNAQKIIEISKKGTDPKFTKDDITKLITDQNELTDKCKSLWKALQKISTAESNLNDKILYISEEKRENAELMVSAQELKFDTTVSFEESEDAYKKFRKYGPRSAELSRKMKDLSDQLQAVMNMRNEKRIEYNDLMVKSIKQEASITETLDKFQQETIDFLSSLDQKKSDAQYMLSDISRAKITWNKKLNSNSKDELPSFSPLDCDEMTNTIILTEGEQKVLDKVVDMSTLGNKAEEDEYEIVKH